MEKEKRIQQHGRMKEAMFALEDIFITYPTISPKDVMGFAPIYYPMAMVEMKLEEETFENFEAIQLAVLELIQHEIRDYRLIAETLGLSANYIFKVIRLMMGIGHVNEKGITDLGTRSLERGEKITYHQVWQKFQLDALNGTLLRVEELIAENMMDDKDESNLWVGHLNYLDGIDQESIENQLMALKYESFIFQKSGILNTNVISINDVKFKEIKYAKAYMMKIKHVDEPLVFGKKYNATVKDFQKRFTWGILSLREKETKERLGIEDEIPKTSSLAKKYIEGIWDLIVKSQKSTDIEIEIKQSLRQVYPFDQEELHFHKMKENERTIIYVDERALKKFRTWVLEFLYQIDHHGEYLMTDNWLYGNLVSLRANSPEILSVGKLLSSKIKIYSKSAVFNRIKKKLYDDNENESTISKIREVLEEL